jgi:hypothetical protein
MKSSGQNSNPLMPILASKGLLNIFIFMLGVGLPILLVFGFGFYFIFQGLFFAALILSPHNKIAYVAIAKVAKFSYAENTFTPLPIPWWRYPVLFIRLGLRLFLVGFAVWFLLTKGFCNQNIICMLATH